MSIDIQKLKAAALACTPNQLEMVELGGKFGLKMRSGYQGFFNIDRANDFCTQEAKATCTFIGQASPAAILSLIAAVESATAPQPAQAALSDEQIFAIYDSTNNAESQILSFARAIESAALSSHQPAAAPVQSAVVPDGYVLFPVNPNEELLCPDGFTTRLRYDQYKAMVAVALAGAPSPAPVQAAVVPEGWRFEADDGTVAAYIGDDMQWHAHIYVNDPSINDVEVADQVVSMLAAASQAPSQAQAMAKEPK